MSSTIAESGKLVYVDKNVVKVFPDKGAQLLSVLDYGKSHWGKTAQVRVKLKSGEEKSYFLKVIRLGDTGCEMCEGEYESLKAIDAVVPGFVPKPYAWGPYEDGEAYFLLAEFREFRSQPAKPESLAKGLAKLHAQSVSPTGRFGFHTRTNHGRIRQNVGFWDDSWCAVLQAHLGHIIDLAGPILVDLPNFDAVAQLVLKHVVPRLLLPLQQDGRTLKPSLLHGDCWDGNTATDACTGEAFVFDPCSFYGHSEYDVGNWRAPRHELSDGSYMASYKKHMEPSEPKEDWDARNLLYSLPFNLGNAMYMPASDQGPVVYKDMVKLCELFCKDELAGLDMVGA
ncbi:uncharacterized protein LMH87_008427 [Akanthomyces muscarius]|uniref:protein-ribulosamine 3-kinase n=1 Tax=Akanthomyces muscarius TaxID=2231603 RepID=A0A9W8QJP1_AKAMU|nr:uncharacterized protein LMH87_008427 [Akanthomyces muscarius]KAJ4159529.1 hypothetical protein LMH87_008427 [Akanthomyces muscarius]